MRTSMKTFALLLIVAGCRTARDAPSEPMLLAPSASASVVAQGLGRGAALGHPLNDSTEKVLISQVKKLYTGADAQEIERELTSPYSVSMRSSNPKAQKLIDQVFARRRAWSDSVAASQPNAIANRSLLRHVTVGIVDSLSDPSATAEIWRRRDLEPHDVILVSGSHATSKAIQAAIHGYGQLWRGEAQGSPAKNLHVVVHGDMHMNSWTAANDEFLNNQMSDAMARPKAPLVGLRNGHYFDLILGLPPSANARP